MAVALAPSPPAAVHLGDDAVPWIDAGEGVELKVLLVREKEGLWIIRNRFQPGARVQTHRHTGPVFGYTIAGAWKYAEYEYVNRAGSFLYEPAGSVHTLTVPETNAEPTDVWFQMYGCNLNLDADGKVESVIDGRLVLDFYLAVCQAKGLPKPPVLVE
jgi:quercetin dioxygenase-like cupin family protein